MSTTLNLVDHLLASGRRYQELGRFQDAVRVLTRLSGFRELPGETASETQIRLAEVELRRRKFKSARRHLTAALHHEEDNGQLHYLMATAVRAEDRGDFERAAEHYRRSLELNPDNVKCRSEFGLMAVRMGESEEGIKHLRQAAEAAPSDPEVIGRLVKGLRLAGYSEEAREELRKALFQNPRQPRFRKMWEEHQYRQLRRTQRGRGRQRVNDADPVLLPFVRVEADNPRPDATPTILRREGPSVSTRQPDQRNVQ